MLKSKFNCPLNSQSLGQVILSIGMHMGHIFWNIYDVYSWFYCHVSETSKVTLHLEILPVDLAHTSLSLVSSPVPCSSLSSQSSPSPALSSCSSSRVNQSANVANKWHETFEIPWHEMQEEVQSAIANSKWPAPDKQRQMIHILVEEIRKHEAYPRCNECLMIFRKIIKQYPSSSADM